MVVRTVNKILTCLAVVLFCSTHAVAQTLGDQLNQQLQGRTTLAEIMAVVDPFYASLTEDQRNSSSDGLIKYKHWKRWEWYLSRRLGPNGEFVHIPKQNLEVLQRERARTPQTRQNIIDGTWRSIGMTESSYSADTNMTYAPGQTGNTYANGTGRIDRIAFHPTDPDIIYAGASNGGLWRTEDAGDTWECLTDTLPSIGISGIVVQSTNVIYILTGTGDSNVNAYSFIVGLDAPSMGVMKSTDAGVTWAFTDTFPTTAGVTQYFSYDLVQSPTNTNVLLAATSDGIFRTANGGTSWTKVKNGLHFDLLFKPGSGTTVYATDNDSIFYSTNGGVNWLASTRNVAPNATALRVALASSESHPARVYAFYGNAGVNGQFAGVYRSENSGVSFTRQATTPNVLGYNVAGDEGSSQPTYDLCIAVHPDNSDIVMLGSINLWRSVDSAATFTNYSGWFENQGGPNYCHPDHHALAYNPLNDKFYSCNDGGIWVSEGDTIINISEGLVVNQFYHLAQHPTITYKLVGGLQDNGVKLRPSGTGDFVHMYGADGFSTDFMAVNPNTFYCSINGGLNRIKYSDGSTVGVTPSSSMFFKNVLAHPTDSNIVFCGTENIFRSTNRGQTWINEGPSGSWAMTISRTTPTRMYSAGSTDIWPTAAGAVYTSSNTGDTWTNISGNPGYPANVTIVTDLAVDPQSASGIYVTIGGFINGTKVVRSLNAGATWTNISYNLPNIVVNSVIAVDDGVFVGTDISVYYLQDGTTSWIDVGENIPHSPVIDLVVDQDAGVLTAATFGRGIWQRNYCVDDIDLDYPLVGALEFSCDDQLTSTSEIPGSGTDSVQFNAGGKILLTPGFKVNTGAYFKATNADCEEGELPLIALPPVQLVGILMQPDPKIQAYKKQD